jgi:glutamate racemase
MSDLKNSAVQAPVGVFDSGLGGLAVLQELRHLLPHEQFIYCADQANLPYGQRSLAEVRHFLPPKLPNSCIRLIRSSCW